MLGDRRNNSLFAPAAATSVPESKPEQAEVHDIAFEEDTGRSIFAESKVAPKASDLFFAPPGQRDAFCRGTQSGAVLPLRYLCHSDYRQRR